MVRTAKEWRGKKATFQSLADQDDCILGCSKQTYAALLQYFVQLFGYFSAYLAGLPWLSEEEGRHCERLLTVTEIREVSHKEQIAQFG